MTLDPTKLAGVRSAAEFAEAARARLLSEKTRVAGRLHSEAVESFAGVATPATVIALCDEIERLSAENGKLRAAISWIEPPFVDEATSPGELRTRIQFAIADAARSALSTQTQGGGENG